MSEGDGAFYNAFKAEVLKAQVDFRPGDSSGGGHDIRMILVTGYTPDIDVHEGYDDVSAYEVSDSSSAGYDDGGLALTGKTVTKDDSLDEGTFDANDPQWVGLDAGTPSHCILYDNDHPNKCLICYWEVTTPSNGSNYKLVFAAAGIFGSS